MAAPTEVATLSTTEPEVFTISGRSMTIVERVADLEGDIFMLTSSGWVSLGLPAGVEVPGATGTWIAVRPGTP
jgi:hypothetical protein